MSHEIARIMAALSRSPWFIEPRKAEEIVGLLALRAAGEPRAWKDDGPVKAARSLGQVVRNGQKNLHMLRLHGAIMPRANLMTEISGATSLEQFQAAFREAAADANASHIVLDVDSPGGMVDQVPETVALIRKAKRAGRPIVAQVSGMACSAAYWIASACDEITVTPSGSVGSIGVYSVHEDISAALEAQGIKRTMIFEGPRKVEMNPFGPLDPAAKAALQAEIRDVYDMFTADVAAGRGVPVSVVRADPESADRHFGGGRSYRAPVAVRLGMADREETFDDTVSRLIGGGGRKRIAAIERRRLTLM